MAIKIPDAPNIIGSDPVLRSPEQVRGQTITPQLKAHTEPFDAMIQGAGAMLQDVHQERIDTYMTQASLWWTEMMNKRVREITDPTTGIRGAQAMDLYVRELKPYAKKLTDQLIGAPKDDGMVRIANPILQKQFQKWADGQMRNYNAQIARYEGQELARYNESTFDAREQQISEGLMQATTPEEIVGYSQSMLDLNKLRYRGYNPDRVSQLAAAKVDAAVKQNVANQINNDIEVGYNYFSDPQVQAALSSASKAELRGAMRKALLEQGKARGGEGLANNDTARIEQYTNRDLIREIYNTDDEEIVRGVQLEIMGGANDRAKALQEKAAGVQSQINATLSAELANAKTEEEFGAALQRVYEADPVWAEALDAANQRDAVDAAVIRYVSTVTPNYDKDVAALTDVITQELNNPVVTKMAGKGGEFVEAKLYNEAEAFAGRTIDSADYERGLMAQVRELELSGMSHEDAVKTTAQREARLIAANKEYNDDTLEMMARYDALRDRLADASETYTQVMNDVVSGTYTGGRDYRVSNLPLSFQRDIYAAVGTEGEYRRLINSHPGVDDVFKEVDATYPNLDIGYKERARRMAMYRINDWEKKNGDTASGKELKQLVQLGYADAKDPVSSAMESAINSMVSIDDLTGTDYWTRETRTDVMAEQKRLGAITAAATPAFSSAKAETKASNKDWDKQTKVAQKKVKKFRDELPRELRSVVDANLDMYTRWYAMGNTNAIINHVNAHRSAQ